MNTVNSCPLRIFCCLAMLMWMSPWVSPVAAQVPSVDASFVSGADDTVHALATLPGGDLIVAGDFSLLGGQSRHSIGRLRTDGSVVPQVQYGAVVSGGSVSSVLVQDDGRVVIGGTFTQVDGMPRQGLARLLLDGSVDPNYMVLVPDGVWTLAALPDGSILAGGPFTQIGGQLRYGLARVLSDGQVDPGFVSSGAKAIAAIAVQPDGRVLIGGIQMAGAEPWPVLQRLLPDGQVDPSFQAHIGPLSVQGRVAVLAVQSDGRILVGGLFEEVGGGQRRNLARLHSDGSLDTSFQAGTDLAVTSLLVQADGRIVVGGIELFWPLPSNRRLFRVLGNGQPDPGFDVPILGQQTAAYAQEDGGLLFGGSFSHVGSSPRQNLARLQAPAAPVSRLLVQGSTVRWQRSGSAAELSAAPSLALSMDAGASFSPLTTMVSVAEGWRADGVQVPVGPDVVLRARGRVVGGRHNGSSGLVEQHWHWTDAVFRDGFE